MIQLGFLGAGKMATALAGGLIRQGVFTPAELLAVDVKEAAREQFTAATGVACVTEPADLVVQSPVVLLAVKPQDSAALLTQFQGRMGDKLLISIAAGLAIAKLSAWTASERVVGTPRACMPSLMMYFRTIGPSAARPSPRRAKRVGPEPLS